MSFLRKSVLVSSGQALAVLVSVLGTVILARALDMHMGQYDLYRNVAIVSITAVSLGVGNANIYVLNGRGASLRQLVGNTLLYLLVVGGCLAVAIGVAISRFSEYFGRVPAPVAACFGAGVAALLGSVILRSFLVAQLAAKRLVALDVVVPACTLLGAAVLAPLGRLHASSAVLLYAFANIAALLVALAFLWPHLTLRLRFDRPLMKLVLSQGVRLYAANALQVIGPALAVVLLRYLTLERGEFGPVAVFTRASSLCGLATLVPTAVGPLLYARWSGAEARERAREVELTARLAVGYGVAVTAVLAIAGKYLLWALYGAAFIPAYPAVLLLAPATGAQAVFTIYLNLFASDGRADVTAWIFAATCLVTLAGSYLLVPWVGMLGACVATLLSALASVVSGALVARRVFGVRVSRSILVRRSDVQAALRRRGARGPAAPLAVDASPALSRAEERSP